MLRTEHRYIKIEKEDNIATVVLNRPEALNAIHMDMHKEVTGVFDELAAEDVRAIVLTGAGRAFCAGGDVKTMASGELVPSLIRGQGTLRIEAKRLVENILDFRGPVIAAVNGPAAGLGASLALFCDIIVASEEAIFSDMHVRAGLVAGDGGAVIWPLLVGVAKAKEFLLTGDPVRAREAERIGLVNRVVSSQELLPVAKDIAKRLASGPTLAVGWTKACINKRIKQDMELIFDSAIALEAITMKSEDHKEASAAFVEKRKPQFKGR